MSVAGIQLQALADIQERMARDVQAGKLPQQAYDQFLVNYSQLAPELQRRDALGMGGRLKEGFTKIGSLISSVAGGTPVGGVASLFAGAVPGGTVATPPIVVPGSVDPKPETVSGQQVTLFAAVLLLLVFIFKPKKR
jgi:hypothetical protein